jgi:hypothetical protein
VSLHLVLSERSRGTVGQAGAGAAGTAGLPRQHLASRPRRPRRAAHGLHEGPSPAPRWTSSTSSRCPPTTRCSPRRGPS